jgi:hypothetical protein
MEIIDKLNTIRRRVLNGAASCNEFKNSWSNGFVMKELAACLSPNKGFGWEGISLIKQEELKNMSRDVLYSYGFGNWNDELILIPLWLVNFLDQSELVTSINGDVTTLGECDKDVRGGCIAYGFYL